MVEQTGRHPQILIVENDPSINSLMRFILVNQDHWNPNSVVNGEHAVEAWQSGNYDVILMDIKMPVLDGIDATKKIRELERETGRKRTPIIGFTACHSKESRQKCLDAGMDEFITKPTKMTSLVETVSKYIPDYY